MNFVNTCFWFAQMVFGGAAGIYGVSWLISLAGGTKPPVFDIGLFGLYVLVQAATSLAVYRQNKTFAANFGLVIIISFVLGMGTVALRFLAGQHPDILTIVCTVIAGVVIWYSPIMTIYMLTAARKFNFQNLSD